MPRDRRVKYVLDHTEELPNGAIRYVYRKVYPGGSREAFVRQHLCPHCGGPIFYRFHTDGETNVEAYIADEPREE